jgi:hypothetical protein
VRNLPPTTILLELGRRMLWNDKLEHQLALWSTFALRAAPALRGMLGSRGAKALRVALALRSVIVLPKYASPLIYRRSVTQVWNVLY